MKSLFFILIFLTQTVFAQSLKISQFPAVSNTAITSGTQFVVAASGTTRSLKLGELDKRWSWTASSPLLKTGAENSVLSIPSANAGTNGYLLSTDWIDFSSKLSPSGAATVTNKDIDGGTASNSNRLTLPKNSKTNLDALTRKEGTLVYDTTGAKVYYDDGSTLKAVGSGSGGAKNYVTGGDAESGISGFLVSKNTSAGASPDSGFVSTGTTITFAVSTTAPLADSNSFLITKTAANSQGQQVYVPFTIDSSMKAKVAQISFDYLVNSGTFAAGTSTTDSDVTVWIYDVTNAVFIQPSSYRLLSNSGTLADRFTASFQTSSNSTSYRLLFHVATTSASAFQLKVDNIAVSPSVYVYGSPVSSVPAYTPALVGVGTPSALINTCQREGAVLKCHGSFNTGTVTGVTFQFPLPPGLTLSNAAYGQKTGVGKAYRNSGQSENVLIAVGGRNYLTAAVGNDAANKWTEAVGSTAYASSENTNFEFSVFIEGWASSVQMSDQTGTRAVSFAANKASGQAVTANVTNISYTSVKDSHGAWNGTDTYIVQVPGDYLISATTNATGNTEILAYVNGVSTSRIVGTGNTANWLGAAGIVPNLKTGDALTFRATTSVTINGSGPQNNLSIFRISGPVTIAATDRIAATYIVNTSTATTANTQINFNQVVEDTHGAVTVGAGVWNFKAPAPGTYTVIGSTISTTNFNTKLYKNGSFVYYIGSNAGGINAGNFSFNIPLLTGDTIDIRPSATATMSGSANGETNISIVRQK